MSAPAPSPRCAACGGSVEPYAVCAACGTETKLAWEDVGAPLRCVSCGAEAALTHICADCGSRFLPSELGPAPAACAVCGQPLPAGAIVCPSCGAQVAAEPPAAAKLAVPSPPKERPKRRLFGEYDAANLRDLMGLPGVDAFAAELLCRRGFNALWKVMRASPQDIAAALQVSRPTARRIIEVARAAHIRPAQRQKPEVLDEEWACPLCGVPTSLVMERCVDCGAAFDEPYLEDEVRERARHEARTPLAFYDLRLLEDASDWALWYARALVLLEQGHAREALEALTKAEELAPNERRVKFAKALAQADAFAPDLDAASATVTSLFDTVKEQPLAEESALAALAALEALGGLRCASCGAMVPVDADRCPECGAPAQAMAKPVAEPALPITELEQFRSRMEAWRAEGFNVTPLEDVLAKEPERARTAFFQYEQNVGKARVLRDTLEFLDVRGFEAQAKEIEVLLQSPFTIWPIEAKMARLWELIEERDRREAERQRPMPLPVPSPPVVPAAPPSPVPVAPPPSLAAPPPSLAAPAPSTIRPGLRPGVGLVNGRGKVNGLINGIGFVNGAARTEVHLPRARGRSYRTTLTLGAFAAIALLVLTAFPLAPVPPRGIVVDGQFADWEGVPRFADPRPATNPNVALREYAVSLEETHLSFLVIVSGTALGNTTGWDTFRVFVDTDGDTATGYRTGSLGAEHMFVVSGGMGAAESVRALRFQGQDAYNWSAWRAITGAKAAAAADRLEMQMSLDTFASVDSAALRVTFEATDGSSSSASQVAVGTRPAALLVRQSRIRLAQDPVVPPSGSREVVNVTFQAFGEGPVAIQGVTLNKVGPGQAPGIDPPPSVQPGLAQAQTRQVTYDAAGGGNAGDVVRIGVASVDADAPVTIEGDESTFYLETPYGAHRVDGLFAEWTSVTADTDVGVPPPAAVDLRSFGQWTQGSNASVYARVAGEMLAGTSAPDRVAKPPPSTGGPSPAPTVVPVPRQDGADVFRAYVDVPSLGAQGLAVRGLLADFLLELRGAHGRVLSSTSYRWDEPSRRWIEVGPVDWGKDDDEVEVRAVLPAANLTNAQLLVETSDWTGRGDRSEWATGRGTRGGSQKYVPMFSGDANHHFVITSTIDEPVDLAIEKLSMRFTAQTTIDVDTVRVYATAVGNPPVYRVGLQGNSGGNPDGTWLGSGTWDPVGGDAGWRVQPISPTASLTAGTAYHMVLEPDSGSVPDGSNHLTARTTTPNNQRYPGTGATDSNTDVRFYNGATWSGLDRQPLYILQDTTGTTAEEGNPFHNWETHAISGSIGWGNQFTVGTTRTYDRALFFVRKLGSPPAALALRLNNSSTTVTLDTVPAGDVPTSFGWVTFDFSTVTLSTGVTYRLYLTCSACAGGDRYETTSNVAVSGSPYEGLTFDGTTTQEVQADESVPSYSTTASDDVPFELVPEFPAVAWALLALLPPWLLRVRRRRR